jgi:hypothetical protein
MAGRDPQPVALGEDSRVQIGNFVICVKRGTVTENPAEISTTCNETQGFNTRTRGPRNLEIEFEGQVRVADAFRDQMIGENPILYPPNLKAGTNTDLEVKVWVDFVNAPLLFYHVGNCYVNQLSVTIDGEGVQTYTASLKNQGPFMTPSDQVDPESEIDESVLTSVIA